MRLNFVSDRSYRPRRAVLFVPASNEKAIAKLPSLASDAVIFDLEDSVAPEAKAAARERLKGVLAIDYVVPDYYARYPKPCMGGWGRQNLNVTPSGKVLPCHAAESITSLSFDNVKDRPLVEAVDLAKEAGRNRVHNFAENDIDLMRRRRQALAR